MTTTIGEMFIVGKLDMRDIKRGLRQTKAEFAMANVQTKMFAGDIERIGRSSALFAAGIVGLGAAAAASLLGLATISPAVSTAFTRIGLALRNLGMAIGAEIGPAVQEFASFFTAATAEVALFISGNQSAIDTIKALAQVIRDFPTGGDIGLVLAGVTVGGAVGGAVGGPGGAVAGAVAGGAIGLGVSQFVQEPEAVGAFVGAGVGAPFGPAGMIAGGVGGYAIGHLFEMFMQGREQGKKEVTINAENVTLYNPWLDTTNMSVVR